MPILGGTGGVPPGTSSSAPVALTRLMPSGVIGICFLERLPLLSLPTM